MRAALAAMLLLGIARADARLEIDADDPNFARKMMWGDFTAGGHSNFYDFAHWRGTGRTRGDGQPSRDPPDEVLEGARHLRWLIDRVPFWEMEPADDCVASAAEGTQAMALASPGRCYVVYLLGAPIEQIKMAVPDGAYTPRWYDPKTGELTEGPTAQPAGGRLSLRVPAFSQDTVLWLEASEA